MLQNYYERPDVLRLGAEPARTWYLPEDPNATVCLNGVWDFSWFGSVEDVPETIGSDPLPNPVKMPVPSVWQHQGFDCPQYTNIRYPIPYDPPYVPRENPCGVYRRTFEWNEDGKRCYLNFDGVDSCYYVWVNGEFVGLGKVSHNNTEFDITGKVVPGENTLTVAVLKWCDATYLEDQDKFRCTGIFRDVYLVIRPQEHLRNVITDGNMHGDVSVRVDYCNEAVPATATLYAPCGCELAKAEIIDGKADFKVENPQLWTAETPTLYTVIIEAAGETIRRRVGLRTIEVKDGVVLVNGLPVLFRGVNRHDSDPYVGPAVDREHVKRDLRIMKEHNVNAIRTSHYPSMPCLYEMADEYGFYVVSESDIEIHGAQTSAPFSNWETQCAQWALLADDPAYHDAIVDRVQRNVLQFRSHSCIVMWSLGNESGYGPNFEDAARWIRATDPTRLVHYEGIYAYSDKFTPDHTVVDTHSRMYTSPADIRDYFAKALDLSERGLRINGAYALWPADAYAPAKIEGDDRPVVKPYILCEFAHAMGNGPGSFEEYWQVFEDYPGMCGGFVWEWCDHAVCVGSKADGTEKMRYGGDFGEFPHDGNFCMDGLVLPDRTPSKALLEFKNVIRPARCTGLTADGKGVVVNSKLDHGDLGEYATLRWQLLEKGVEAASGACELPSFAPHGTMEIALGLPEAGEDASLLLTWVLKHDTALVKAGHVLGFDQVEITRKAPETAKLTGGDVKLSQHGHVIAVDGETFHYVFDTKLGSFCKMVSHNRPLIDAPMTYNIWRAPTDNDMYLRKQWSAWGYDCAEPRTYGTTCEIKDGCAVIACEVALLPVYRQRAATIHAVYTIDAKGVVSAKLDVERKENAMTLPRFGVRLMMPRAFGKARYLGYGPGESYSDCRCSAYRAQFEAKVGEMESPYLKPQEAGSHWGCDWAELSCACGMTLRVQADAPFSFSASEYTQEELTAKAHIDEIEKCGQTVLCIDYKQNGIGSNSCGPVPEEQYCFNEKKFTFSFSLSPEMRG